MTELNQEIRHDAADNLQSAWLKSADNSAKELGRTTAAQENFTNRVAMVSERLDNVSPSSKVLEKANKFVEKQAQKLDAKLKKMESKYKKSSDKATMLGTKSTEQANVVAELAKNKGSRLTGAEVTKNWQMAAAREGANVNIKDGNGWFDRNVTNAIDNLRIGWNEMLSRLNAGRAEKEFSKATGYKVAAEGLRSAADSLRQTIAENNEAYNTKVSQRQTELSERQATLANALSETQQDAADAATRLDTSRTVLPDIAEQAADQIRNGADIGATTEDYYKNAQTALDSKANNQVQ